MRASPEFPGVFELAAEWTLIAELLRPPSEGFENRIRVATLMVNDPELLTACDNFARAANSVTYRCLFGSDGEIQLVESSYRPRSSEEALHNDLESLYSTFGFKVGREALDHIVTLASFISHLRQREGMARLRRSRRLSTQLCVAAQQVIRGHLLGFVEPLAVSLDATEILYLSHVAHALLQRCGARFPGESSASGLLRPPRALA